MRQRAICLLILCTLVIAGCGFKPRSGKPLPRAFHHLYFSAENPFQITAVRLKAMLAAMQVTFVRSPQEALYTLQISHNHFTSSHAEITNANLPSSIRYALTATISIINNNTKQVIVSRAFIATQALTLNANQIYVPNANYSIKRTLSTEIEAQIYYWLITENLKQVLRPLNHETKHKHTRHTS